MLEYTALRVADRQLLFIVGRIRVSVSEIQKRDEYETLF